MVQRRLTGSAMLHRMPCGAAHVPGPAPAFGHAWEQRCLSVLAARRHACLPAAVSL